MRESSAVMEPPRNFAERLFTRALREARVPKAEVMRNDDGALIFRWPSPCSEIEALLAIVEARAITLSCRVTHTHFSRTRYLREKLTNLQFKRRMVQDSIREVGAFIRDRIAVTTAYDENGKVQSSGWYKKEQLAESLDHLEKTFGSGMTQKAWSWSGPA